MADTNPNTQRQRQSWQRGQQAEFRFKFLKRDQTPMISLDATKYPGFAIYSCTGTQVQTGTATAFGDPGSYRVLWTVPEDADLTNDNVGTWCIVCTFIDSRKKSYELSYDFEVREKRITSQENRDLILLGVENSPFRITWRGDSVPVQIQVQGFNSIVPDQTELAPLPVAVSPTGPVFDGDSVIYYRDLDPAKLVPGMYTFIWNVQEQATSPTQIDFQQLRIIPKRLLQAIPQVKFIVGRFQAAFHLPNYISDADYVEGLMQGVSKINQWHPLSSYSYSEMLDSMSSPSPLSSFWLMASAWWVLHSQHMVEVSLGFNMSGASATLDYDRTSGIESSIARLQDQFSNNLTQVKIAYMRQKQGMGVLSVRPAQLKSYQNRVFLTEKTAGVGATSQLMSMMTLLGIAP